MLQHFRRAVRLRARAQMGVHLAGISRFAARSSRNSCIILAYHNVVPDSATPRGDSPLHIPVSRFRDQIDRLSESRRIISLGEVASNTWDQPVAAITFDDAYRGAVNLGLEELATRDLPATMFVAPGLLGNQTFWWDDLGVQSGSGLAPRDRSRAVDKLAGRHQLVRQEFSLGKTDVGPEWMSATVDEIGEALAGTRITVGSHSWSHPNLAAVGTEMLVDELRTSKEWLQDAFGEAFRPWLSYPYGLSSADTETAAATIGYELAFGISVGWLLPVPENRFRLPRVFIPGDLSNSGFELRLAGLLYP